MLKAHEELLAQIELAEEAARAIHARGARVDGIVHGLRRAGNEVKERIAHYKRDQKKASNAGGSPSPRPSPPGEGAPQQPPERKPQQQQQQQQQQQPKPPEPPED